jgi:hypothetical protein
LQQIFFFFWGPLKKNPTKIWGANPPLASTMTGNSLSIEHKVSLKAPMP